MLQVTYRSSPDIDKAEFDLYQAISAIRDMYKLAAKPFLVEPENDSHALSLSVSIERLQRDYYYNIQPFIKLLVDLQMQKTPVITLSKNDVDAYLCIPR